MSLKDPKKVHETDDFAIFKGSNGHEIKIFKKALTGKLKKELEALPVHAAEGYYVDKPEEFEPGKDYSKAPLPGEATSSAAPAKEKTSEPVTKRIGKLIGEYGVAPVIQGVKDTAGAYGKLAEGAVDIGEGIAEGTGLVQPKAEETKAAASQPQAPQPQPAQQPDMLPAEPTIQEAPRPVASALPTPQKTPEQVFTEVKSERDQDAENTFLDLLRGNITPKTYQSMFEDKSTLGKLGTVFGLILSGAGAGLTKGPNLLLEMMNKELDRDLEAQKKSVEGAQNFYRLSLQEQLDKAGITKTQAETAGIYKDIERKALENAKTRLMLSSAHHLMRTANLLPEDKRAAAGPVIQGIQGAVVSDIGRRNEQAALNALGNLGMLPGAEGIAAYRDARHVPGVGDAQIPVSEGTRKEIGAHQALEDSVTDLLQYSKKHVNLVPGMPGYNEGVTKLLAVQQMIREGLLGTVFRESEKPLLRAFVGADNPAGAFKMLSTQPKLRSILESNRISSDALKKQYGLPTKGRSPEEGARGTYNGRETVFKNGKWRFVK